MDGWEASSEADVWLEDEGDKRERRRTRDVGEGGGVVWRREREAVMISGEDEEEPDSSLSSSVCFDGEFCICVVRWVRAWRPWRWWML